MKKIIKTIDLINLVYEGKAPKKVIYNKHTYTLDENSQDYQGCNWNYLFEEIFKKCDSLSTKIEIIEEDEKPKEIKEISIQVNREVNCKDRFNQSLFNHFYDMDLEVRKKINELTKAVNYLLKKDK